MSNRRMEAIHMTGISAYRNYYQLIKNEATSNKLEIFSDDGSCYQVKVKIRKKLSVSLILLG